MTGSLNLSISGETYGRKFINILTLNKYIIVQIKPLFYWEYSEVALCNKYVKVMLDSVFIDQSTQILLGKKWKRLLPSLTKVDLAKEWLICC